MKQRNRKKKPTRRPPNAAVVELEQKEPGLPQSPPREVSVSGPSGYFTMPEEGDDKKPAEHEPPQK